MKRQLERLKQFTLQNKKRLFLYVAGFIIMGFAVNIIKASNLGNGAWDTVTINIRSFFNMNVGWEWVTLGTVSFTVSMTIFTIVVLYRKEIRYAYMMFPIILAAIFIDFWNIVVFKDILFTIMEIRIISYVIGLFLLPFGLVLIIKSGFPAFVFDELMMMFVRIFKAKKITAVRFGIEIIGILIGTIFGFLTFFHIDGGFGAVNIGSFFFTIVFTPIMAIYFKLLKVPHH